MCCGNLDQNNGASHIGEARMILEEILLRIASNSAERLFLGILNITIMQLIKVCIMGSHTFKGIFW